MTFTKAQTADKKYKRTVHDAMTTGRYLYELYKIFFNNPASSAAVE